MALWEYKVISSGKGGFATPALLETFLNQLGVEEWEIIEFRAQPDNPLAFTGLARRLTQREWTLEAAAAAAAKVEADKLRAEFAAKFQAGTTGSAGPDGTAESPSADAEPARDETFRKPRDTDSDMDPYALDDAASEEEEWPEEDQLPSFFEAIRPHMRRNQKGPGYSVGIDYLVKKFDMIEDDLLSALQECGFSIPEDEDDKPVYIEYDGDLYWLNTNRRGELWLNTREKPRPVFRAVKGTPVAPEQVAERSEQNERRQGKSRREQVSAPRPEPVEKVAVAGEASVSAEGQSATAETQVPTPSTNAPAEQPEDSQAASPLPEGTALVDLLRPYMRRSRGGLSGTISFLSRALKQSESALVAALAASGLKPAQNQGEKAPVVEFGDLAFWLNRDGRGGIWINARDNRRQRREQASEAVPTAPTEEKPSSVLVAITPLEPGAPAPSPELHAVAAAAALSSLEPESSIPSASDSPPPAPQEAGSISPVTLPLAGARLLLKQTKTGAFAMELGTLAKQLDKTSEELIAILVGAGLAVPEKSREKAVFVEHAGEIFWLNRNAKGQLWLNAKASKYADRNESSEKKPRRNSRRSRS